MLAEVVEEASEIAFDRYLTEAVFEPLGMADVRVGRAAPRPPASGPTSTVADLVRFAGDLLRPDDWCRRRCTPRPIACSFPGWRACCPGSACSGRTTGDWVSRSATASRRTGRARRTRASTYGHFGQSGTFLWVDPAADLALVVLTDRDFGEWAHPLWPAISDGVLREFGAD